MKLMANLKEGFGSKALIGDAMGILAAPLYTLPASFLKVNGWLGFALAFGLPYLVGKLFKIPALSIAAVGIAATHMIYYFGNETVKSFNSQGMWRLSSIDTGVNGAVPPIKVSGLSNYALPPGASRTTLPSGAEVNMYPAVNDYIKAPLNDYIGNESLNDDIWNARY